MNKPYVWLALAGLLAAPACYTHLYTTDPAAAAGAEVYKKWQHHYLFGLISKDDPLNLKELCPSGALQVEDQSALKAFRQFLGRYVAQPHGQVSDHLGPGRGTGPGFHQCLEFGRGEFG